MLYPNATIPVVKDAPWEQPLWKLLGYAGPAPPRRHTAPHRQAPATPAATPVSKPPPPVKASAGKVSGGQHTAPPLPPPARKQPASHREEMTSFAETPRAGGGAAVVSFEAAQVLPPAPKNHHRASDKPPPGRPGPPATASKASRAIWELAASHVAAAGGSNAAVGLNAGAARGISRAAGREPDAGVADGGGAIRDDVVRWVEQSAGHAPPPPHSRPPSSLGGGDGPDTPGRRMNGHGHRGAGVPRDHRSGGTASGGARTWLDDSAFDSPSGGGATPMLGHTTLYGNTAWAGAAAGSYEHLVSPDVVWDAVVDVAHSLDLFGPEEGAAFDGTDASRNDIVDAAIRAAASDGWSCSVCGKRFAFTDVALAQACEAKHASADGRHAGSPAARARALSTIMASPVRSSGGSGGWDESPVRGGEVSTTPPQRGAGPQASKLGGSPRDAAQAAANAAAMASTWPSDEAASPWQPVSTLDAADPRQRPAELASRQAFNGSAPLGRVYTSADARARMGGASGRGCTVPTPGQCAIQ